ncbi:MAG: hypothetical protein ACO3KD_08410, partial [Gaiellales bacterium]
PPAGPAQAEPGPGAEAPVAEDPALGSPNGETADAAPRPSRRGRRKRAAAEPPEVPAQAEPVPGAESPVADAPSPERAPDGRRRVVIDDEPEAGSFSSDGITPGPKRRRRARPAAAEPAEPSEW